MKQKRFVENLLGSEELLESLKNRQFLLDTYIEDKKPKPKKGPGRPKLEIPFEEQKYELYIPLHEMWKEYVKDLLNANYSEKNITGKLLKADMHGAMVGVWRAACRSYEGQKGIVVQETQRTFRVITQENKVKSKP